MNISDQQSVDRAHRALKDAARVAVLTGAGMSAASGLPTYRGVGGLYNAIEIEQGMPIEEILHAYTLTRNPALTWKYIAQIEHACRGARPNEGHEILALWDKRFEVYVVTQNVDGFHRDAGSRHVIELHGNLRELFCLDCEKRFAIEDFDLQILPPRCAHCDGLVRPNAVLFGEQLPARALALYEEQLSHGFDVMLAIGTTAGFPYVTDPMLRARRRGTVTIEINPDVTPLSAEVDVRLALPAVAALHALNELLDA